MVFSGKVTQVESDIKTIWLLEKKNDLSFKGNNIGSSSLEDSLKLKGLNFRRMAGASKINDHGERETIFFEKKIFPWLYPVCKDFTRELR